MAAPVASIDTETRSTVDLRAAGVRPYFEHPSTEVLCMSWRIGDGPVHDWRPGKAIPLELTAHVRDGGTVVAHKNNFDRTAWNLKLPSDWPKITIEQSDCTMARAQSIGLPASLDALGAALKTPIRKDKEGYALMMKMCKPQADGSWYEPPGALDRLAAYCHEDVATERSIGDRLPPLTPFERRVWEMDQHINDQGVQLDRAMVENAILVAEELVLRANVRMAALTDGFVTKVTQAARIVRWLNDHGVPCESISEGEHEELFLLNDMIGSTVAEEVIKLRASSAKAFKFKAMKANACADWRARDQLLYSATVSGRWVGQGIQVHNMKRVETEEDAVDVALAVRILHSPVSPKEMADRMELLFDEPLDTLSICSRACIVPGPARTLVGGDFSNIEGRLAAWITDEQWKLSAFRDFDAGVGPDLYKVTAAAVIGCDVEDVTKAQRQEQGKVPELACGYQGSVGAFMRMGQKYGVKLLPGPIKLIVDGWRAKNYGIVNGWAALQDAAIEAVSAPGCVVSVFGGKVKYICSGDFLYCQIPSGGIISYASPSVAWKTKTVIIDGDPVEFNRRTVSYWGSHKGWRQIDLYGGMQFAHVVSRLARDVLCTTMLDIYDEYRIRPVLTVHDELLYEGGITAEQLRKSMLKPIDWLGDCPISASTWEGDRYVK